MTLLVPPGTCFLRKHGRLTLPALTLRTAVDPWLLKLNAILRDCLVRIPVILPIPCNVVTLLPDRFVADSIRMLRRFRVLKKWLASWNVLW